MYYRVNQPDSSYLNRRVRSIEEVCRSLDRDNGGRNCAECPLRGMCQPGEAKIWQVDWGFSAAM